MVRVVINEQNGNGHIILRPNLSASWRANLIIISLFSAVCIGIALFFLSIGAYLVLPFAGLEILVLFVITYLFYRDNSHQEVISFTEQKVIIEKGRINPKEGWQCERAWAQARLIPSSHPWYPSKLGIQSHANFIEIGRFLCEEEREQLNNSLNKFIFNKNRA